ncbi:hypothetical protein QP858_09170 [Trueperella bernardiae]|uniref:Lipoprotein n=2 Tax=Actinomycetes TaxID=1760 RepID=A0AAW6ZLH3_9ACTO|nr:hypothetical protein [Trueperella bernardiae]MDK8602625.1 hypothetical protein [Trueperella bernardiae]
MKTSLTATVGRMALVGFTVVLLAGCSAATEEIAAGDVAQEFARSVASKPDRACDLLAPETRAAVEQDGPCAEQMADLDIPTNGRIVDAAVAGHSARVSTAQDRMFLALFDSGWRVMAAGCGPAASADNNQPADCVVKD